jgi:hypothetical protein
MRRATGQSIIAALGFASALSSALVLGGCSSAAVIDQLPSGMSEPAATPARPTTAYQYPAVHDMPPPRAIPTMSEEQEFKAEKDLAAIRDKQKARTGADKRAAKPAKKKPETGDTGQLINGQGAGSQDGAPTKP